jgi:DNA-binding SARP family transcriptional activator
LLGELAAGTLSGSSMPVSMIRLQTLESIDLRAEFSGRTAILAQPKRLALLIYLATARPADFQSRDRLLALLWPERDPSNARTGLMQSLHQLRLPFGEEVILTRGEREVGLDFDRSSCDAAESHAKRRP